MCFVCVQVCGRSPHKTHSLTHKLALPLVTDRHRDMSAPVGRMMARPFPLLYRGSHAPLLTYPALKHDISQQFDVIGEGLACHNEIAQQVRYHLLYMGEQHERLVLCQTDSSGRVCDTLEPLDIGKFFTQKLSKQAYSLSNSALLRAVKLRDQSLSQTTILDATAGMGKDSLIMRHAGAMHVHMVEQNPVLCVLLAHGMSRVAATATNGTQSERLANLVQSMSLQNDDSTLAMQHMITEGQMWDVVYVDPMYPIEHARKRVREGFTKPRHDIAFLRRFLAYYDVKYGGSGGGIGTEASDGDYDQSAVQDKLSILIQHAVQVARRKVIVKRPSYAPKDLYGFHVKHSFSLKDTRYDMILA